MCLLVDIQHFKAHIFMYLLAPEYGCLARHDKSDKNTILVIQQKI